MKKTTRQPIAVERLIASLEKRIKTYEKNLAGIRADAQARIQKEFAKIADARLQLKALKKQ